MWRSTLALAWAWSASALPLYPPLSLSLLFLTFLWWWWCAVERCSKHRYLQRRRTHPSLAVSHPRPYRHVNGHILCLFVLLFLFCFFRLFCLVFLVFKQCRRRWWCCGGPKRACIGHSERPQRSVLSRGVPSVRPLSRVDFARYHLAPVGRRHAKTAARAGVCQALCPALPCPALPCPSLRCCAVFVGLVWEGGEGSLLCLVRSSLIVVLCLLCWCCVCARPFCRRVLCGAAG
jgi:hypothetical protein